ncbi:MAG: 3-phosphoshikimate 1-carboxyvinyltransferase [Hyphomonadaceae bacterium]|nr:3-phosphoshikimate 1-carboxyvinyltransferase [Hyphomonadaceae bacterium]
MLTGPGPLALRQPRRTSPLEDGPSAPCVEATPEVLHSAPAPLSAPRSRTLSGRVRVPGDKSISHRALMFGALATGRTRVTGLLEAQDILNTVNVLRALGCPIAKVGEAWEVLGRGVGGLAQPTGDLDFGNAGTGARLMMGVIAGHDMTVRLTGDASLSRRPMGRVLKPLLRMGLEVVETGKEILPLTIRGTPDLIPIEYQLPVPSAQIKSAVLIAGLHAAGETTVIEPEATRDHTERMLGHFGAQLTATKRQGVRAISVRGDAELVGQDVHVPGDPSSAAFLAAAALIVPGSEVTIGGMLINPTRTGFYATLKEMGGDVTFLNERDQGGEPVADVRVRHSRLKGVSVPASRAPAMIDEYPVLACLAAYADGETRMEGLGELKVKESDRLAATAAGLRANGVSAKVEGDTLIVGGGGAGVRGGGTVATHLDHRIAMAFLMLGLGADRPVTVDDAAMIATSFPDFRPLMEGLGASFTVPEATR